MNVYADQVQPAGVGGGTDFADAPASNTVTRVEAVVAPGSPAAPAVVVVSGHMVDAPGRSQPRFPHHQVPRVTARVRDQLARWRVGPGTELLTGGARGADIIAAEVALGRGAAVRLVLSHEPDVFVANSVALPHTDWEVRFRALIGRATIEVVGGAEADVYARTNQRILERAREVDDHPRALIVWDGGQGDGPGGTSDFVARLGHRAGHDHVVVIDPAPSATAGASRPGRT